MKMGIVIKPITSVLSLNDEKYTVIDEVLFGMNIGVNLSKNNDYYRTINNYSYEGYINKEDISIVNHELFKLECYKLSHVISSFADIFIEPNFKSQILITLPRGSYIYETGKLTKDGFWKEVVLEPNKLGWVRNSSIKDVKTDITLTEEELRKNIVSAAMLYLSTKYRKGGKSPLGIDDSALCSMAYLLNDININRNSTIKSGFPIKEISIEKINKADLLYFKNHMALYIGNGQFIHSWEKESKVIINSLNKYDKNYEEVLAADLLCIGSYFY